MTRLLGTTLIALLTFSSSAFAAAGAGSGEVNLLTILFLGFFALIIVCQLVPATLMLIGILKGVFGRKGEEVKVTH